MNINISERELATILAALRFWQGEINDGFSDEQWDIASGSGVYEPLDAAQIDTLCENMNCGKTPFTPRQSDLNIIREAGRALARFVPPDPSDPVWTAIKCAHADLQGALQAFKQGDIHAHDWKAHKMSIEELEHAFPKLKQ